jgi:hypothetical protein
MNEQVQLREASKGKWTVTTPPTVEQINTGALQRIADALELIAQDYRVLIQERDYYKRELEAAREQVKTKSRQVAAYKGRLKKMKKEAKG